MPDQDEAPLVFQQDRECVTEEPEPSSGHHDPRHQDVDWIGHANQGGGYVPEDYSWTSNPRQDQEDVSMG